MSFMYLAWYLHIRPHRTNTVNKLIDKTKWLCVANSEAKLNYFFNTPNIAIRIKIDAQHAVLLFNFTDNNHIYFIFFW